MEGKVSRKLVATVIIIATLGFVDNANATNSRHSGVAGQKAICHDRVEMPKFVTIGYGDLAGYERTSKDVRDAAHAHDAELKNGRRGRAGASPQHLGRRSPDAELRLHVVPLAGRRLRGD